MGLICKIINRISSGLGSAWTFLAFVGIAVAPAAFPALMPICSYVSQTVIQLVALSAITRSQQLESAEIMKLLTENHESSTESLREMHLLVKEVHVLMKEWRDLHGR